MHNFWLGVFILLPALAIGRVQLRDLSLDDAESIAMEYNKEFLISIEGTREAMERQSQALSRLFPSVVWEGSYTRTENEQIVENIDTGALSFTRNFWVNKFELNQPLLTMELYYGYKMNRYESEGYEAQKLSTENDLLLVVRQGYYAVVLYEISLEVQKENIDYLTEALNIEQKAFDSGTAIRYQVNQSKVAVSNAISSYYSTLKQLQNARKSLMDSLGVNPIHEKELSISENHIPVFDIPSLGVKLQLIKEKYNYEYNKFPSTDDFICHAENIDEVNKPSLFTEEEIQFYIETALAYRPELKEKEAAIEVANADIGKQKSRYLPEIIGFVDYQYNAGDPGSRNFSKEALSFAGGVKFEWTLFDSLFREHKVKEAISKRSKSWLSYQNIRDQIELNIRNQVYQIEDAMLTFVSSSEGVLLAEEAMRDAKERLRYGTITPLEYRDTVNSLAQSRDQRNFSSYNLLISYYQLRHSMGLDVSD